MHVCEECFRVHVPDPCCPGCSCGTGRRAPVQAERDRPAGSILWWEHQDAWVEYARRYGGGQSAERIAERGGFGFLELAELLGREPETWERREEEKERP